MRNLFALILLFSLSLVSVSTVNAQAAEKIWIQANTTAYKTNETITVTINALSTTPIQGFNAQVRYDPACLQPVNGTSPIAGLNGLAVPQVSGLADASFASTTPLQANGVVAELRFTALKGCQTGINLETASLVVRNESGFAVPVTGVQLDQNVIALNIDSAVGSPTLQKSGESVLPLAPTVLPEPEPSDWNGGIWLALAGIPITLIIGLFKFLSPVIR
jgi:hypothetical protein